MPNSSSRVLTRARGRLPGELSLLARATLRLNLSLCGLFLAVPCATGIGHSYRVFPQAGLQKGDERAVLEAERAWERALMTRDAAALDRLLAPNFVSRNTDGEIRGKRLYIEEVVRSRYELAFLKKERVVTRGGDTYSVRGRVLVRVAYGGNSLTARFRYDHRFVRRGGRWVGVGEEVEQIKQSPE
jgi:hypothetical protein